MLIEQEHTLEQIKNICFQELSKGGKMKKHPFRFVSLATIQYNKPRSRWVVHRNLTAKQHILVYTDARSEKVTEIRRNPAAALLYFHDRHSLQLRINGAISIHHKNELSRTYWPGVKGAGAKDYNSILAPGKQIDKADEAYNWDKGIDDEFFMVLEFVPDSFEVLQLNRGGHIRASFKKVDHNWEGSFLVP